jgi:nucleotide-binding universal stress UspA family protein
VAYAYANYFIIATRWDLMKILLAIDDSQYSAEAVEEVASRPWPPGTMVRVLSAVHIAQIATEPMFVASVDTDKVRREMTKFYEELTTRAADSLRNRGAAAETAVRQGDPRSVIVDEARDWAADLIVLGSHGYSAIKRWLLGSVAQAVVSYAPCSVEIVRRKATDEAGYTELMKASLVGDNETVKHLLSRGVDMNAKDREGRTALMFATINTHNETVRMLLEHGVDVNATANDGGTALLLAASNGDLDMVRLLLSKGSDVNGKFISTGKTALMLAEEKGHTSIIQLLTQAGAVT